MKRAKTLIYGVFLVLMFLNQVGSAWGHQTSDSYLHLTIQDNRMLGQWDIAIRDLQAAISLDDNYDSQVTWQELLNHKSQLTNVLYSKLRLRQDRQLCPAIFDKLMIDEHSDGMYAVLLFSFHCEHSIVEFMLDYDFLFEVDALHKGLLSFTNNNQQITYVFSENQRQFNFTGQAYSVWQEFVQYVRQGIWHIWIGYDHILFLIGLLLPSVWRRSGNKLRAVNSAKHAILDVVKLVTAFTLAHSITLLLAVLNIVSIPAIIIETLIALSVIIVALNNIYPFIDKQKWRLAFGFGLVHGFGFANVLTDLGLENDSLLVSLLSFNVGVELGQLSIVLVLLPLMYALRSNNVYKHIVYPASSVLMAIIGGVWLFDRALVY